MRTDNADSFEYEETLFVAQGENAQAGGGCAARARCLFLEVRAPSPIVDVSIIVADDIPSGEG